MDEKDRRIADLEGALAEARVRVRTLLLGYEAMTEQVRGMNEDALEADEELRGVNQKLQTAREQVQSAYDELRTLNQALQERDVGLGHLAEDLLKVLDTLDIPIVIVGNDLSVRRFTASARRLLNLISTDIGRPLTELRTTLENADLAGDVRRAIETLSPVDRPARDTRGREYALRIRPYRKADRFVDGAVVVLMEAGALGPT
jgi:two-component system, chemotaxis family, CheB/CheR fusion protein